MRKKTTFKLLQSSVLRDRGAHGHYNSQSNLNSLYSKLQISSSCLEKCGWVLSRNH